MNINNEDNVIVTDMNTLVELKKTSKTFIPKPKIKRIDKIHYVDTDTGEVKRYRTKNDKTSSRKNNPESLARTGRTNKGIIICNFEDKSKTQYITLTYDEHVFDYHRAYDDFKAFIKTIRRNYCSDNQVKYVVVQEEHYDGGLHFHCLLYWDKEYPMDMVKNLPSHWHKGDAVHKPIKDNKDILFIASYLVSGYYNTAKKAKKTDIAKSKEDKAAIKNVRLENTIIRYSLLVITSEQNSSPRRSITTNDSSTSLNCLNLSHPVKKDNAIIVNINIRFIILFYLFMI